MDLHESHRALTRTRCRFELVVLRQQNAEHERGWNLAAIRFAHIHRSALHQTGQLAPTDSAYGRGVWFLMRTQAADGSWMVKSRSKPFQPYYEGGSLAARLRSEGRLDPATSCRLAARTRNSSRFWRLPNFRACT